MIEVLLVLAVAGLVAGLLIPGINSMLHRMDNQQPDQIFFDLVNHARERALTANRTVLMQYDKDRHRLSWHDDARGEERTFSPTVSLQLLPATEGHTALLGGGVLVELDEIPAVHFYADGSCDRFRLQLREGTAAARIIAFDPWTCAPMLAADNAR